MSELGPTPRTRLTRKQSRGSHERGLVHAIIDAAWLCHVAFVDDAGHPAVLPLVHSRLGERLYVHGAARGRLLSNLADGRRVCVNLAIVDGLVLARSQLHHSMNYRSVVIYGSFRRIDAEAEKRRALSALVDRLVEGRSREAREPSAAELGATLVVGLDIVEASAKCRTGPPLDAAGDLGRNCWAGVLPLVVHAGPLDAAPDLSASVLVPEPLARRRGPCEPLPVTE
jgi:nitroimidazol reductase NimA-like FMN-containing flavoprotein (pyridoxamine 5'-phosphate oxidase superfamily)